MYREQRLARLRFLVPILMVVMVFLYDPVTKASIVALAIGVIGYNIVTLVVLGGGSLESAALKRLGLTVTGLDIVVASLTFVLFVGDPTEPLPVLASLAFMYQLASNPAWRRLRSVACGSTTGYRA